MLALGVRLSHYAKGKTMKHVLSFFRSPIGYVINAVATVLVYVPVPLPAIVDRAISALCETFCAHDGVQDDALF